MNVKCPNCGAPIRNLLRCEYCGTLHCCDNSKNIDVEILYADNKPIMSYILNDDMTWTCTDYTACTDVRRNL